MKVNQIISIHTYFKSLIQSIGDYKLNYQLLPNIQMTIIQLYKEKNDKENPSELKKKGRITYKNFINAGLYYIYEFNLLIDQFRYKLTCSRKYFLFYYNRHDQNYLLKTSRICCMYKVVTYYLSIEMISYFTGTNLPTTG